MANLLRRWWCRVWHGYRGLWAEEIVHDRDGALYTAVCSRCGSVFSAEQSFDHD